MKTQSEVQLQSKKHKILNIKQKTEYGRTFLSAIKTHFLSHSISEATLILK